jgi:CHASE3 domain sensor protein
MIKLQLIRKAALWMGVVLPLAALFGTIWVTHETNGQFSAAFASVTRTYKILNVIEEMQTHISDAETGRRGWLLTGRGDYFQQYGEAMATFNNDIQQLRTLMADNPIQQKNFIELQKLVVRRLALPEKTAPSPPNSAVSLAVTLTDEGRDTMNQIRTMLFSMREQETGLLALRQRSAEDRFIFDQTASLVLVGVTAIALIAIVAILIRLEQLRQIVTVCAWTGQVKHEGEWIPLDKYLERRFGLFVSHGLSDEAAEKMRQDIGARNQMKGAHAPDLPRTD